MDYATAKGLSRGTLLIYAHYLKKIIKKNKVLNKEVLIKLLKSMRHQTQRAVLVLINEYCYHADIDFRLIIPKIKSSSRPLPETLPVDEVRIIIESVPKPYDLMLRCIFNIGGGLRISEAIKLSWDDIKWYAWLNSDRKGYGIVTIKKSKGGKDRTNNIPHKLMEDLYGYAKKLGITNENDIPIGRMIFNCDIKNYKPDLFINNREKWKFEALRHAYDWFRYNILKKYCEKALGHKLHIHQLRHTRATYLYEVEKIPLEQIQKLLGHSSITTTLIYTKISMKDTFDLIKNAKEL